jgi:hypothetical protein
MNRLLPNWLDSYLAYVEDTESALIFKKWVGISVISSVLRRKVWLQFGRIQIYPNLFVVLVGPPGTRKTQAISFGKKLLEQLDDIRICPDATTKEALCKTIAQSKLDCEIEGMSDIFVHCSVTAINSEFETLMGKSKDNGKMVAFLLELWDCPDRFTADTKHVGKDSITNAYFNLLAASTQESLASCLPKSATGNGLIARLLFCCADEKHKNVPIPNLTPEILKLKESLIHDLAIISYISGKYDFTPEAREYWIEIYDSIANEPVETRACRDPNFTSWYDRKQDFIKKISLIDATCTSNEKVITVKNINKAMELLKEIETHMSKALRVMGRSEIVSELETVMSIIYKRENILETSLRKLVLNDLDDKKFINVIESLVKAGKVKRDFKTIKTKGSVTYSAIK